MNRSIYKRLQLADIGLFDFPLLTGIVIISYSKKISTAQSYIFIPSNK